MAGEIAWSVISGNFYGPNLEIVYIAFVHILLATYSVSGKCGLAAWEEEEAGLMSS